MMFILYTAAVLLSIFVLLSLISIIIPLWRFGLKSRVQAIRSAAGSALLLILTLMSISLLGGTDKGRPETAGLAVSGQAVDPPSSNNNRTQATQSGALSDAWMVQAVEAALEEQLVFEAMFPRDTPTSFWASVQDDGTDRSGYAEYLCLLLYEAGMPEGDFTVVTVWDRSAEKQLGRYECVRQ